MGWGGVGWVGGGPGHYVEYKEFNISEKPGNIYHNIPGIFLFLWIIQNVWSLVETLIIISHWDRANYNQPITKLISKSILAMG